MVECGDHLQTTRPFSILRESPPYWLTALKTFAMKLTKENCVASISEKGNIYITHPEFKVQLRFYASVEELQADKDWREKVSLREGDQGSFYAVLAKTPLTALDV